MDLADAMNALPSIQRRRILCACVTSLPVGRLWAAEAPALRIETIQSEPFGRLGPQGPGGLMYELGELIAQRAGLAHENRVVPYARTVLSLQGGSADMVLRFSNDELKVVAVQVAPVLTLPTILLSRWDAPLLDLERLEPRVLAVSRSFPVPERLLRLPQLRLQAVNSNEHAIQMLLGQRVDAAYGSNLGLYGAARALGHGPKEFARPQIVERQTFWLHLARSRATPELIARLAKAVESLERDGTLTRLYHRTLADFGDEGLPV